MVDFKLINDNMVKDIPQCPIVTYELVADLGKYGVKTVYEISSLAEIYVVINEIRMGELNRPNLCLTADELENIETISINVILTATELDIIKYSQEQSARAELKSYKVIKE